MYEISVKKVEGRAYEAYANIKVDNDFVIGLIKVFRSNKEDAKEPYWLSFPSFHSKKTNEWRTVCNPVSSEFRTALIDAVHEAMKTGQPVIIGSEKQDISVRVTDAFRTAQFEVYKDTINIGKVQIFFGGGGHRDFVVNANLNKNTAKDKIFVKYESYRQMQDDGIEVWKDIMFPLNAETRTLIIDKAVKNYEKELMKNKTPDR